MTKVAGKICGVGWELTLYSVSEFEERATYQDIARLTRFKLVYANDNIEEEVCDIADLNNLLIQNGVFVSHFSPSQARGMAEILCKLNHMGELVCASSPYWAGVEAYTGQGPDDITPQVASESINFVVFRSYLMFKRHGFFLARVSVRDMSKYELCCLSEQTRHSFMRPAFPGSKNE
ncbi:hypothetical protein [Hahella sp. HN01]|uniref:hypothetical protein n=1 Tax=Hahella sp. HN01 TaxID=2847262 RepID=UPI001C1EFF97|nr:hypothetical protein [Hahella sp. HN01]MBU6952051.1 hypothetical protein [Hahella sp. HN01]